MPVPNLVVRAAATIYEGTTVYCLGRLKGKDASHNQVKLAPGDLSEINYVILNKDTNTQVDSGTLDPAEVLLAAISNGTIWTFDAKGFDFIAEFDESFFTVDAEADQTMFDINIEFVIGSGSTAKRAKGQWGVTVRRANTVPTP